MTTAATTDCPKCGPDAPIGDQSGRCLRCGSKPGAAQATTNGGTITVDERAEIIAEIQRRAVDGRPPSSKKPDQKLSNRAKGVFGSWNAAIEAAGFEPNRARTAKGKTAQASAAGPDPEPVEETAPEPFAPEAPQHDEEHADEASTVTEAQEPSLGEVAEELHAAWEEWGAADERLMSAMRAFEKQRTLLAITAAFGDFWFDGTEATPESSLRQALKLLAEQKAAQP